jgi:acetyl esterase/lipase
LDVYRPQGAQQAPVMLFWHGGSWKHGDKDYYRFVGACRLRGAALSTILPNYRLAPDHPFPAFCRRCRLGGPVGA